MTKETFDATALKMRPLVLLGRECVEGEAVVGVEHHQLIHVAPRHGADRDSVAEVESPRILRSDERLLKARLGEDQHLRVGLDVEMFEETGKIPEPWPILECRCPVFDLAIEAGNRIVSRLVVLTPT